MSKRSALRPDLFAGQRRRPKLDRLGDPQVALDKHIDFAALAAEVDRVAPRPDSVQGGRPPYPTETMVRISQHFDAVIDAGNTGSKVYADRGYPSKEREAALKARGRKPLIQRKAQRNRVLSERQKEGNRRIATVRVRVEHVFGAIAQMGGKLLRTIGQTRADFAMTMMAVCYNLKRLAHLESVRRGGK